MVQPSSSMTYDHELMVDLCFSPGGGSSPSVFAATMGSVILRYSLTLPSPNDRLHQINRAFISGKTFPPLPSPSLLPSHPFHLSPLTFPSQPFPSPPLPSSLLPFPSFPLHVKNARTYNNIRILSLLSSPPPQRQGLCSPSRCSCGLYIHPRPLGGPNPRSIRGGEPHGTWCGHASPTLCCHLHTGASQGMVEMAHS